MTEIPGNNEKLPPSFDNKEERLRELRILFSDLVAQDVAYGDMEQETLTHLSNLREAIFNDDGALENQEAVDLLRIMDDFLNEFSNKNAKDGSRIEIDVSKWKSIQEITKKYKKALEVFVSDRRVKPKELKQYSEYKSLLELSSKIKEADIEYFVLSNDPKAPTIILAPQAHYDLEDQLYRRAKQIYRINHKKNKAIEWFQKVHERFIQVAKKTRPGKFYLELESFDREKISDQYFLTNPKWSSLLEEDKVVGLRRPEIDGVSLSVDGFDYKYFRLGLGNVHQADIVIDDLRRKRVDLTMVVIGYSHEKDKQAIPMSAILASTGINVVVLKFPDKKEERNREYDNRVLSSINSVVFSLKIKMDEVKKNDEFYSESVRFIEEEIESVIKKEPGIQEFFKKGVISKRMYIDIARRFYFDLRNEEAYQ
ncbi:hypothetical protein KJ632_02845 [Patescibacteria group bacterium]|nr:hypothetical protein [Patescibacteria group bacterium]